MDYETKLDALICLNPNALVADGFDAALIGVVKVEGEFVALYDSNTCIDILVHEHDMGDDEAIEFFEFNTLGAYVGPHTPAFTDYGLEENDAFTVCRFGEVIVPRGGDMALFEEEDEC